MDDSKKLKDSITLGDLTITRRNTPYHRDYLPTGRDFKFTFSDGHEWIPSGTERLRLTFSVDGVSFVMSGVISDHTRNPPLPIADDTEKL